MNSVRDKLNDVLNENGLFDHDEQIQEKLLSEMDSLRFIQLVVAIENTFEIGVPDEYLLLTHYKNIEDILKIVTEALAEAINEKLKNVNDVVENSLCVGCSACLLLCPYGELEVDYNKYPFPTPITHEKCDNCGSCLLECPAKADK